MTEVNYLESLNPLQYESVCSTEGPNLIIAGAGVVFSFLLSFNISSQNSVTRNTLVMWPSILTVR